MVRGFFAELRTGGGGVLWHLCLFEDSGQPVWPSGPVEVPFRSVCGAEPVCALLKFAIFLFFFKFFCFFPRRFEHGRFSYKGGREMTGKIPTTFAVSCNRPTALWASQPSLLCFLFPSLLLKKKVLSTFSNNFPSPPLIFRFFQRFLLQATRLHVTTLSAMCHKAQDTETNATCCGRGFCLFLRILRHIQKKKGPNYVNSIKRKVLMFT